jgi:hypothetical protein
MVVVRVKVVGVIAEGISLNFQQFVPLATKLYGSTVGVYCTSPGGAATLNGVVCVPRNGDVIPWSK